MKKKKYSLSQGKTKACEPKTERPRKLEVQETCAHCPQLKGIIGLVSLWERKKQHSPWWTTLETILYSKPTALVLVNREKYKNLYTHTLSQKLNGLQTSVFTSRQANALNPKAGILIWGCFMSEKTGSLLRDEKEMSNRSYVSNICNCNPSILWMVEGYNFQGWTHIYNSRGVCPEWCPHKSSVQS